MQVVGDATKIGRSPLCGVDILGEAVDTLPLNLLARDGEESGTDDRLNAREQIMKATCLTDME